MSHFSCQVFVFWFAVLLQSFAFVALQSKKCSTDFFLPYEMTSYWNLEGVVDLLSKILSFYPRVFSKKLKVFLRKLLTLKKTWLGPPFHCVVKKWLYFQAVPAVACLWHLTTKHSDVKGTWTTKGTATSELVPPKLMSFPWSRPGPEPRFHYIKFIFFIVGPGSSYAPFVPKF